MGSDESPALLAFLERVYASTTTFLAYYGGKSLSVTRVADVGAKDGS